jgi:hypothetical protein
LSWIMRAIIAFGLILLGATGMWILAHRPKDPPHVTGLGLNRCKVWVAMRAEQKSNEYEQWVMGYLSGVGYRGPPPAQPKQPPVVDDVFGWMDSHCLGQQAITIGEAAQTFFVTHQRPR